MKHEVTIIDYGLGNLFSVAQAFEAVGAIVRFVTDAAGVGNAQRLVLPGVGAFADGMKQLKSNHFVEEINAYIGSGRPLIGICLGMQLLFTRSYEFGEHVGLSALKGDVKSIPALATTGEKLRVPNVGWNELMPGDENAAWVHPLFAGIRPRDSVYFVHSFSAHPEDPSHILATAHYGGHDLVAAVSHENVLGCQFHPEKSGQVGLRILKNFLAL